MPKSPFSWDSVLGNVSPLQQSKRVNDAATLERALAPGYLQSLRAVSQAPGSKSMGGTAIVDNQRYGSFTTVPLLLNTVSQLVLPHPTTTRIFLFIINLAPVNQMVVNFGNDAAAGLGITLAGNLGFIGFDAVVPQDDIFMVASAAGSQGVLVYSNTPINS